VTAAERPLWIRIRANAVSGRATPKAEWDCGDAVNYRSPHRPPLPAEPGARSPAVSRPYTAEPQPGVLPPPRRRAVLWPRRQAILQQLDLGRLLRAAGGRPVATAGSQFSTRGRCWDCGEAASVL